MDREFLIGIELSEGEIKGGLVDLNGKIVKKITVPCDPKKGKKKVIDSIIFAANKLRKESILGVGIAVPGFVDSKKGVVLESDIPGFNNLALKQALFDSLHLPIFLENLANCLAIAEHRITFSRKIRHMVNVDIGESVSLGMIISGKLYRGAGNIVGRMSHSGIAERGARCECGNIGCLDLFSSERAIIAAYRKLSRKSKSIEELGELAKKDKRARKVLLDAAKSLGVGLANIVNMLDPEVVVLSGNAPKIETFLAAAKTEMERRIHDSAARRLTLVTSDLEDAGILGASSIVMSGEMD